MSRLARIVTLAAASLAMAIHLVVGQPSTAEAGSPQTRMFDWNTAGAVPGYGNGAVSWLNNLRTSMEARGANIPGIVTLQEVCRPQAQYLSDTYLWGLGYGVYAMYDARGYPGDSASFCSPYSWGPTGAVPLSFGNIVWVWGPGQTAYAAAFSSQFSQDGSERRGLACVGSTFYGINACTAHMTPRASSGATWRPDCQLGEFVALANYTSTVGNERIVISGDFNIDSRTTTSTPNPENAPSAPSNKCSTPPSSAQNGGGLWAYPTNIALAYNGYWESDQSSGGAFNQATHGSRKIDYIFMPKSWGAYAADLSVTGSQSDHYLLEAYLWY